MEWDILHDLQLLNLNMLKALLLLGLKYFDFAFGNLFRGVEINDCYLHEQAVCIAGLTMRFCSYDNELILRVSPRT